MQSTMDSGISMQLVTPILSCCMLSVSKKMSQAGGQDSFT